VKENHYLNTLPL